MALGSRSVTATAYRFEEPSPGLRVHQSGNCAVAAQVSNGSLDVYRLPIYNKIVIRSFRDEGTEKIFHQQPSKRFRAIEKTALRKLFQLQRALSLRDLAAIPGNQLEALKGNRKGQYSIRINDQYRICFRWEEGDACDVEITDYH